jgi:hypothetical protein
MDEAADSKGREEPIQLHLWRAGMAVVFAAVLSNVLAHFLLSFLMDYPSDFAPLRASSIAIFTGAGALAGTLVYAWLRQRIEKPERSFGRIGWLVLGLSILPNIVGIWRPDIFSLHGSTSIAFLTLIPFHLIAGVVIIGLLTRLPED